MKSFRKLTQLLKLKRLLFSAAIIVVFVVSYSLVMPAITMERKTFCGKEEHAHTDECYTVTESLVCGQDECEGHTHTDDCYTDEKILVCELEENEEHTHGEECYETEHILQCDKQETPGHTHTDACYETTKELTCEKEEHKHSEECFIDPAADQDTDPAETKQTETKDTVPETKSGDRSETLETKERESGEETESAAESEETEETEESVTAEAEIYYPAVTLSEKIKENLLQSWIEVEVEAPEGALPEGSELVLERYEPNEEYQAEFNEELNSAVKGGIMDCKAVSISFIDAEGEPIIPAADVQVLIRDRMIQDAENIELVKIDDTYEDDLYTDLVKIDKEANEKTADNEITYTFKPEDPAVLAVVSTTLEKTLTAEGSDYSITVGCSAKAGIPDGSKLKVKEIRQNSRDYQGFVSDAGKTLDVDEENVSYARFFDITIVDSNGAEIQPQEPVDVKINLDDLEENVPAEETPQVVHFGDDAEEVDASQKGGAVSFEAEGFSVYGVVYTVDFHWEVDGKVYEFSLPGGGYMSFTKLIEILGVADDDARKDPQDPDTIMLDDVKVSEETDKFTSDVETVTFSNPDLVWIGKVDSKSTVGELKEAHQLEVEYSADLTEAQIAQINAQTAEAGDWALISRKPFLSEESLTVTMKDGEVFTIRVTDAQISKDYVTASGDTYTITVTYDDDAEIPDGCDLKVREISQGTPEYQKYLADSAEELNTKTDDISFARFFDIEIVNRLGLKVEPKAPVKVEIAYKEAVDTDEFLSIVHFADDGTEAITEVGVSEDGKKIVYEQDSFSVTGTIQTGNPTNGGLYMLLVKSGNDYYMINNDGSLTQVPYGQDANGNSRPNVVAVETPMLWTYYNEYGGHFRYASEASGFNANQTASGYYYRYIDPNAASGLSEENISEGAYGTYNGAKNLRDRTVINYNNHLIANNNFSSYIQVVNEGGSLRLAGNGTRDEAAEIILASPTNVRDPAPMNHTVNHIDISISGTTEVTVPLAYGKYYFDAAKTNLVTFTDKNGYTVTEVTPDHLVDLTMNDRIGITADDMKTATIKTYKSVTDQNGRPAVDAEGNLVKGAELNDMYYITGYSANETTAYSTDQVRIEGSFKVADMNPANWWDVNGAGVRQQRLRNAIIYEVTVNKELEVPVTVSGRQIYDESGEPVRITVTVPVSASFHYFEYKHGVGNECPPLQPEWGYFNEWQQGGMHYWGISGMDFVLDGGHVEAKANMVALEISKYIQDTSGKPIHVNTTYQHKYDVYGKTADYDPDTVKDNGNETVDYSEYSLLHSKTLDVTWDSTKTDKTSSVPESEQQAGQTAALTHDYNVRPGMYYVKEDPSSIPQTITDTSGKQYEYKRTIVKTEYVWRNNNETYHTSDSYTNTDTDNYTSIPEVAGEYTFEGWEQANHNELPNNQFLEFFFYNQYEEVESHITPPEPDEDTINIQLEKRWDDNGDTSAPTDPEAQVQFKLWRIPTYYAPAQGDGLGITYEWGNNGLNIIVNLPSDYSGKRYMVGWHNSDIEPLYLEEAGREPWNNMGGFEGVAGSPFTPTSDTISVTGMHPDIGRWNSGIAGKHEIFVFEIDNNWRYTGRYLKISVNNTGSGSAGTTSGGTSAEGEERDPEPYTGSANEYPNGIITLPDNGQWQKLLSNLPTKVSDSTGSGYTTYRYYLVEEGTSGSASAYSKITFLNNEQGNSDHPIGEGLNGQTVPVIVENKKPLLKVKKEWEGEENVDAYPPVQFRLYQYVVGSAGSAVQYPDANTVYTLDASHGWEHTFRSLPEKDGATKYGYYVEEITGSIAGLKVTYKAGEETATETAADHKTNTNEGTLTMINKMPQYDDLMIVKEWKDAHGGQDAADDKAFGFVVQRRVVLNKGQANEEKQRWKGYGSEIIVSKNSILLNKNEYVVESVSGQTWNYTVKDLLSQGYNIEDGQKKWANFEYRVVETHAYTVSDVEQYLQAMAAREENPDAPEPTLTPLSYKAEIQQDESTTTITNTPTGSFEMTKVWDGGNEGSAVFVKVFNAEGQDVTKQIVEDPETYELKPNQVFSQIDETDESKSIYALVIPYSKKNADDPSPAWQTVRVNGLEIGAAYRIQEIGYSDINGESFWETAEHPGEFSKTVERVGYKVGEGDVTEGCSLFTITESSTTPVKVTISNKYTPAVKDFSFVKIWRNASGQDASWQGPITVTLHQKTLEGGNEINSSTFTLDPVPTATKENEDDPDPVQPAKTFEMGGESYEWTAQTDEAAVFFTFTIKDLPTRVSPDGQGEKVPVVYSLTETAPDGYNAPLYGFCETTAVTLYYYIDPENAAKTIVSDDPNLTYVDSSGATRSAQHVEVDDPDHPGQKIHKTVEGEKVSPHVILDAAEAVETDNKMPVIINQPGVELPATGGPGTYPIHILGLMLILLGAAGFLLRRRTAR